MKLNFQAQVVLKVANAIHHRYPADNAVCFSLKIAIYPVESVVHLLKNWGQVKDHTI